MALNEQFPQLFLEVLCCSFLKHIFMQVTDLRIIQKTGSENQSKAGRDGVNNPNFGFIGFDKGVSVEKVLNVKVGALEAFREFFLQT